MMTTEHDVEHSGTHVASDSKTGAGQEVEAALAPWWPMDEASLEARTLKAWERYGKIWKDQMFRTSENI